MSTLICRKGPNTGNRFILSYPKIVPKSKGARLIKIPLCVSSPVKAEFFPLLEVGYGEEINCMFSSRWPVSV